MIKTIAVCDKCHCECEGDSYFTIFRNSNALLGGTVVEGRSDVCEKCYDKMLSAFEKEEEL